MMSHPKVKLGILLPTRGLLLGEAHPKSAELVLNLSQRAEEDGLDSVWVGVSLTAKPRLEPLSTLAAVAARTQRVRLGTAVLLMALRHPVPLTQTIATVDLISQGRLIIAAGVGGAFNVKQQQEWQNAGVKASQRARRLEEMVQIVKGLGSGQPMTFRGRHFDLDSVAVQPPPVQPGGGPILLACHWRAKARDAQIQRAAKWADGVISISDTPEEYGQVVRQVRSIAADLGRDSSVLETVMYLTVNVGQNVSQAEIEAEKFLT